jgi:hypothetical protein
MKLKKKKFDCVKMKNDIKKILIKEQHNNTNNTKIKINDPIILNFYNKIVHIKTTF